MYKTIENNLSKALLLIAKYYEVATADVWFLNPSRRRFNPVDLH